jgi:four helix bundle protein
MTDVTAGPRTLRARSAAPVFDECYRLILEIYGDVRQFPKSERYLLGQRIEQASVGVLASLVEANHETCKAAALRAASIEVEKLRVFVRLAKDLGFLSFGRYEALERRVDIIGRMLGGWIKWAAARAAEPACDG